MEKFEKLIKILGSEMKNKETKSLYFRRADFYLYRNKDTIEVYTQDPWLSAMQAEGDGFPVDWSDYTKLDCFLGKVDMKGEEEK